MALNSYYYLSSLAQHNHKYIRTITKKIGQSTFTHVHHNTKHHLWSIFIIAAHPLIDRPEINNRNSSAFRQNCYASCHFEPPLAMGRIHTTKTCILVPNQCYGWVRT